MVAIDPVTRLALALDARPGAYCLLLGSGLSTAAGIPTGWQVVGELARRLAAVEGATTDDPALWFEAAHGRSPTYSDMIEDLAQTVAERQSLVVDVLTLGSGAFPPPTPAHEAIAALVAGGWVRVVISTNFDPLIENALAVAGVSMTILSTADLAAGALPLVHSGPTLVKLHGDYRDSRILNTTDELSSYPPPTERLLDRIFDDYGLIVCGWSSDHDTALRAAISRCPSRRFGTYWAARSGRLTDSARSLVEERQAEVLAITNADDFLCRLVDGVQALDVGPRSPASVAIAVGAVKRDMAGESVAISAHDRLREEIVRLQEIGAAVPLDGRSSDQPSRLAYLAAEGELLVALLATVTYWGSESTDAWWTDDISRFATRRARSGATSVLDLPRVPGLLMLWSAGIAAVAAGRSGTLRTLMSLPAVRDDFAGRDINPVETIDPGILHTAEPIHWLYRQLRAAFVEHLGLGKDRYAEAFERWQYLLLVASQPRGGGYARVRVDGYNPLVPLPHRWLMRQLAVEGASHPLVALPELGDVSLVEAAAETASSNYGARVEHEDREQMFASGPSGTVPSGLHFPGGSVDDPDIYFGWARPDTS